MADATKPAAPAKKSKLTPEQRQGIRAAQFSKVATRRINSAVKAISMLRNLANRNAYHYSDEQAAKILAHLREEVEKVRTAFEQKVAVKLDIKL